MDTHHTPGFMSARMKTPPATLILMGVCGCGKSLIGSILGERLGGVFEDADDFHPAANKDKMRAGIPLTDEDRWPWFGILRQRMEEHRGRVSCYVLACSALKQSYRDFLRKGDGRDLVEFVYLKGTRELILARMAERKGHYMPTKLLDSQFAILEEPEDAIVVEVDQTPEQIVTEVLNRLRQGS
jgi:gluconokinase